jgi:Domain of unknown function (4846)
MIRPKANSIAASFAVTIISGIGLYNCSAEFVHAPQDHFEVIAGDSLLPDSCTPDFSTYKWKSFDSATISLCAVISEPRGFYKVDAGTETFAHWLRHIPIAKNQERVLLFNGQPKNRQDVHHTILDIDPGKKDLQQCADACMRLRAEYLFSARKYEEITFRFTSGDPMGYADWMKGKRIKIEGNKTRVVWQQPVPGKIEDHKNLRTYLDYIFMYAGTLSLDREMRTVKVDSLQAGDLFIRGGSPGHAVMIMDVARNTKGETVVIVAQSYMPAQQIHVVKNFEEPAISPWIRVVPNAAFLTPEWDFSTAQIKRFQ